jgi:beta-lactamase superfamily II metal-dependent hydrolase
MGPEIGTQPAKDEIEVSVFGPGIGESILVHIGQNEWIGVDCATLVGESWPLKYLRQLAAVPENCIKLIVATHWHSDHVNGLSRVVDSCPKAAFVCSRALTVPEFRQIYARFNDEGDDNLSAPLREVRAIFRTYANRRSENRDYRGPRLAQESELLLSRDREDGTQLRVWALSPSPEDVLAAGEEFARLFMPPGQYATGLSSSNPNKLAVVIYIAAGDETIILGSDLEHNASATSGWLAVIASAARTQLSRIFKVPHHGSSNAFSHEVWDQALHKNVIAVLTPYVRSGLPRESEIARLRSLTNELYVTALPQPIVIDRPHQVQKKIMGTRPSRVVAFSSKEQFGLVRLRKAPKGDWNVQLFGAARCL